MKNAARAWKKEQRIALFASVCFVLFLSLSFYLTGSAEAQSEKAVFSWSEKNPHIVDMTVDRGVDRDVFLYANITVTVDYATTVRFLAVSDLDVSVNPESKAVPAGSTVVSVAAHVLVPSDARDGEHSVVLYAEWESPQGTPFRFGNATVLEVVQNRVGFFSLPSSLVAPSNSVSIGFFVFNRATVEDAFYINATLQGANGTEVNVSLSTRRVELGPRDSAPVQISVVGNITSNTTVLLEVKSASDPLSERTENIVLTPSPPPGIHSKKSFPLFFVGLIVVGAAVVAVAGFTEAGVFFLFSMFSWLFVRLQREKVLDNFIRGEIYGYVMGNPGCTYSEVLAALGLSNGVATYHLSVLEREGFVVSRKDGVKKRFYPVGHPDRKRKFYPNRIQREILLFLKKYPGATQTELARALGESKQVIHYHIGILEEKGLLSSNVEGRKKYFFLNEKFDSLEKALENSREEVAGGA